MDTCIYTAESFHRPPETITTVLIGYTQYKTKKFKKNWQMIVQIIYLNHLYLCVCLYRHAHTNVYIGHLLIFPCISLPPIFRKFPTL